MQTKTHAMNRLRTLALMSLAATAGAAAAQDIAAGKIAYAQCAACHSVDGSNGAGPSLQGILGRKAASFPGFHYSRAMKGVTYAWDAKTLDTYLANPQGAVPGNVMPFSGIADAKVRADLIAYLASLK